MIFAGIDIGSRATKAVLLNQASVLSSVILDTGPESVKTSEAALQALLQAAGVPPEEVEYTVATGYGRILVPFANENVSEISCHARGVNYCFPSVRTILDMGGQDCKAIRCDERGAVVNFIMNDKCAGGTGRFLEIIAEVLDVPLSRIGEAALESHNDIPFNTICAVFAKSEAISCLRKGVPKADILSGLHEAIATRSVNLLKRVTLEKDFSISGGIAKNKGLVRKLSEKVGLEPLLAEDPQLMGALGAALFARERGRGADGDGAKIHYGYADATGDYFITIDRTRCDGCGECVKACPSGIFGVAGRNGAGPRAVVRGDMRKRLSALCPGFGLCSESLSANCHSVCRVDAISHSWDGAR
jgi:predicted CoA-substrate-specific enzyme activase